MSRSGYGDDCDFLDLYRAAVDRALNGKRGQKFLKELLTALDLLPDKRLITDELINDVGECCALGAVCKSRSMDAQKIYYDDPESAGKAFGIATSMAAEIAFENDENGSCKETPEERWVRIRAWATKHVLKESQ